MLGQRGPFHRGRFIAVTPFQLEAQPLEAPADPLFTAPPPPPVPAPPPAAAVEPDLPLGS